MVETAVMKNKTIKHPLPFPLLNVCRYVNPGIPERMEYPLELKLPLLVLKLGLTPDLLILRPKPLPRFIRF
tara:strand:+ start:4296 stop:4508 length:213 start_codon:yes stop_codon:yes gene_type:complete